MKGEKRQVGKEPWRRKTDEKDESKGDTGVSKGTSPAGDLSAVHLTVFWSSRRLLNVRVHY